MKKVLRSILGLSVIAGVFGFKGAQASAFPTCVLGSGEFPFYVYETESKAYLGQSGYRTLDLCKKAVDTRDLRISCAPVIVEGGGSAIVSTLENTVVGYPNAYFTSVEYCSEAIQNTRGGTVCIPTARGGIALFDFVKGEVIGRSYSSVQYCKWASLSAAFNELDPYICAMNSHGSTEVFDRQAGRWTGQAFLTSEQCYQFLIQYRN